MNTLISKFNIYTTYPIQEFQQDVTDYIKILNDINKNEYDNILIIIGGSYWNHNKKYDIQCKNLRMSLENNIEGKNLIINIDGDIDHLTPKNNENNTYVHLKLFLSYDLDCPFIIKLFEFIDKYLELGTKICIINSVFEYNIIISSKYEIINIFTKYKNVNNIKLLNFVNFPSSDIHNKYNCSYILSNLVFNYKNEFNEWKQIYEYVYNKDYKEDMKCNNLRLITFDTFLLYIFTLFFNIN